VYGSVAPGLSAGLRLDGGRVSVEDEAEPSVGEGGLGFGALSPALRYRPLQQLGVESPDGSRGLYLELAGGIGLMEGQVEPVVAPGAGYLFDAGAIGVGPTARYMQVITGDGDTPEGEDVRIMTVGVELVFLDQTAQAAAPAAPAQPRTLQRPETQSGDEQIGGEDVSRGEEDVPSEEVQRVAGTDTGSIIELDERVFFDTDQATLRAEGKRKLDEIAQMYRDRPEGERWSALRVSGHADQRGPEDYNMELSRQRAETVRAYLISAGVPDALIDVNAYGEMRPIVSDPQSASDLQANRRVQFEIVRESAAERE
jgi:outer membrane protein OmpA-like peptidoglycan-associated protein